MNINMHMQIKWTILWYKSSAFYFQIFLFLYADYFGSPVHFLRQKRRKWKDEKELESKNER